MPSNEGASDSDEYTIGNDGCTVISERSPASPRTPSDSPQPKSTKTSKNSFLSSLKSVFFDDFRFENSPEYSSSLRKTMINGRDILSYSAEEVDAMSVEAVKDLLFHVCLEGHLLKRGFRGLQLWKRRFFEIMGSSLLYFDVENLRPVL